MKNNVDLSVFIAHLRNWRAGDGIPIGAARKYAAAIERLLEIEHLAWHLCDGTEERPESKEAVSMWEDYLALSKLLPEDHP